QPPAHRGGSEAFPRGLPQDAGGEAGRDEALATLLRRLLQQEVSIVRAGNATEVHHAEQQRGLVRLGASGLDGNITRIERLVRARDVLCRKTTRVLRVAKDRAG